LSLAKNGQTAQVSDRRGGGSNGVRATGRKCEEKKTIEGKLNPIEIREKRSMTRILRQSKKGDARSANQNHCVKNEEAVRTISPFSSGTR